MISDTVRWDRFRNSIMDLAWQGKGNKVIQFLSKAFGAQ
jgi:hypothetical protein